MTGRRTDATGPVPRRILIVGCGGSGKSTLARALGERTGLPVVHLDRHYWRPGWRPPDRDDWRRRSVDLAAAPRWIIDGHYGSTLDARFERGDALVFLDVPTWLCLARVVRRRYRSGTRQDVAGGCPERLTAEFLRYVAGFRRARRPRLLALLEQARRRGIGAVHVRGPADPDDVLGRLLVRPHDDDEPRAPHGPPR